MKTRTNNSCFTLLELIVVMALLVVMTGTVAPSLRAFLYGRRGAEEARRFVALGRLARQEAVSRGDILELWIDRDAAEYGLRSMGTLESALEWRYALTEGLEIEAVGEAAGDSWQIICRPDGTLESDSKVTLRLHNRHRDGDSWILSLDTVTATLTAAVEEDRR